MKKLKHLPKSIKKAVRYIKHDAPMEQLEDTRKWTDYAIEKRKLINYQN